MLKMLKESNYKYVWLDDIKDSVILKYYKNVLKKKDMEYVPISLLAH